MKLSLLVVLAVAVAQIVPSCDGGVKEVVGWVEEKYIDRVTLRQRYTIVINTVAYDVPFQFWHNVEVGDLVKYDGIEWTIVRKKGT